MFCDNTIQVTSDLAMRFTLSDHEKIDAEVSIISVNCGQRYVIRGQSSDDSAELAISAAIGNAYEGIAAVQIDTGEARLVVATDISALAKALVRSYGKPIEGEFITLPF